MVIKLTESESNLYCRYIVTTSPYKDDFTKIDVVDNYFDKSDYAFVNLSTGEIKSYSDVALSYVLNVLKSANMAMHDVKPRACYKFYTEPHSSKVVDVKLVESKLMKESDQPPKAESSTTLIGRAMAQAGYTDQSLSQSKDLISQDLTDAQITVNAVFNYLKELQLNKTTHDEDKYAMLEDALRTGLSKIKQIGALVQENIQDVEALLEKASAAVKNK